MTDTEDAKTPGSARRRGWLSTSSKTGSPEEQRAKVQRLVLVVVGAGFAAAAFSLLSGQATAVALGIQKTLETAEGMIDIQTSTTRGDDTAQAGVVTSFLDDDFGSSYQAIANTESYGGGGAPVEEYRVIAGQAYVRSSPDGDTTTAEAWTAVADPETLAIPTDDLVGVSLAPELLQWRGEGLPQLVQQAAPFEVLGSNRHRAVVPVGDLRALAPIPAPLVAITSNDAINDDTNAELIFDVVDGFATQMFVQADFEADDSGSGNEDGVTVVIRFEQVANKSVLVEPPTS